MAVSQPPSGWPAGRPLAISLSVMLEGWAVGSAPGIGPMGNPLKPGVADLQALSWAEHAARRSARGGCSIYWIASTRGRCSTPAA